MDPFKKNAQAHRHMGKLKKSAQQICTLKYSDKTQMCSLRFSKTSKFKEPLKTGANQWCTGAIFHISVILNWFKLHNCTELALVQLRTTVQCKDEMMATWVINGDVVKYIQVWSSADKCQDALDSPGSVPCCEMFDVFVQKLVQAESLNKSYNVPPNNNNQLNWYHGNGGTNGGAANGGGQDPGGGDSKQGILGNNGNTTTVNTSQCSNVSGQHPTAMVTLAEPTITVLDVPLDTSTTPLGASNVITCQLYPAQLFESFSTLSSDLYLETLQSIEHTDPVVFASIIHDAPTLFNSACTKHIVKERQFFSMYNPGGALDITSANTGALLEKIFSLYMTKGIVWVYIPHTPQQFIVADVLTGSVYFVDSVL
ncbi:hypothetical protein BT96DRAFT_940511 [Gymnopus androsaceus JB14]|uniref:Uncharacterized protein n=1 Tax=Gymnopus androsaceus JB14 TaxID=1447944 RepID=A0A6A4HKC3_9AGAR|nr:hypothetical protein BT96DRAFT_940511 [Gymnopus androsaceus JB14]